MLTIYHNPRCGKSRQTLKMIQETDTEVEVIEYLKTPPTYEELEQVINKLGIEPLALIRKGESIFKEKYKGKTLSDAEWITAMVENPILIERPIVVKGNKAIIGRPPENVESLL